MNNSMTIETLSEIKDQAKKIEMVKFCIISSIKSQHCRSNLLMFTLDNHIFA